MKTTQYTFIFLLLSFVFTFAQVEEQPKLDEKTEIDNTNSIQAVGDKIEFKNSPTNSILTITDEGNGSSSILIPSASSTPNSIESKLYNINGALYFGADHLNAPASGSAGGWTDNGSIIHNTNLADRVGIGTNNPSSKLSVGGIGNSLAIISGSTTSNNEIGVYGEATHPTSGRGVYGWTSSSNGIGVRGVSTGLTGSGVTGLANDQSTSGFRYGGLFEAMGTFGRGVKGIANGSSGIGVFGETTGSSAHAIHGEATGTGNIENYGGYFKADGDQGRGVHGVAHGINGRGVLGYADGQNGRAIAGYANGTNGRGIYGYAPATGWAGYFDGRGYFSGKVGIGDTIIGDGFYEAKLTVHSNHDAGIFVECEGSSSIWSVNKERLGKAVLAQAEGAYGMAIRATARNDNAYAGYFSGDVYVNGTFSNPSDKRFKKNITPLKNVINSLTQINGYTYNWKTEEFPESNFYNNKLQVGVIAQDLKKVFPNLVETDKDGYKSVDYIKLSVITMQAVKELNIDVSNENQELKERLKKQESTIKELENRLSKIESLLDGKRFTSVSQ